MKARVFTAATLFLVLCSAVFGQTSLENAFPNLSFTRPVDLQNAGDGTNRLFVVEQAGLIWVFENNPDVTEKKLFLDIQDRVNDAGNEEGLLGLAFHPNYVDSGYFYVDYTASEPRRSVIARYEVSATNPDSAVHGSELVVLEVPQPNTNHNGGQLAFGPDGFLYNSKGDGGSGQGPNGQDRQNLLGTLIRIDVDTTTAGANYGIPADNPYVGNVDGYRDEVYAYGFRNPWRFSFDVPTGRLWLGDVGESSYEEIDVVEKGGNYGWYIMEGAHCFVPPVGCDQTGLELPLHEYGRSDGGSVTGGYVYRGAGRPDLVGKYIYADFSSGRIWSLEYDGVNPPVNTLLIDTAFNISSFGVDEDGELYLCAFHGNIQRFEVTQSPVALQGYHSYWAQDHVVVAWTILESDGKLRYDVSRREGLIGSFVRMYEPEIVQQSGELRLLDRTTAPGETYVYRIVIFEDDVAETSFETTLTTPSTEIRLDQNRPNPFNPATTIGFSLNRTDRVSLRIYDSSGRHVRTLVDRRMTPGTYSESWDGREADGRKAASGVYLFRLTAGKRTITRKAVLLK